MALWWCKCDNSSGSIRQIPAGRSIPFLLHWMLERLLFQKCHCIDRLEICCWSGGQQQRESSPRPKSIVPTGLELILSNHSTKLSSLTGFQQRQSTRQLAGGTLVAPGGNPECLEKKPKPRHPPSPHSRIRWAGRKM